MLRPFLFILLLILPVVSAPAREGYVQTRSGKLFEGHLRFDSNLVIVVSAARELRVEVPLEDVITMAFFSPGSIETEPPRAPSQGRSDSKWESVDVGAVRWPGGTVSDGNSLRVRGAGTNIMADSDSFHFRYRQVRGNSQIVARVAGVGPTDPWARAGLMMRDGLNADAANFMVSITAARGGVEQWRESRGESTNFRLDAGLGVPRWLKLVRVGRVFTAFQSPNGKQWETLERLTLQWPEELCVGLAVVGVREQWLNESVFEGVEEGPWLRNRWFIPEMEFRNHSRQRGLIASMDETSITVDGPAREPVPRSTVAHIRFQPLPQRAGTWLNLGRTGVLLNTGEFIEGDCRRIAEGRLVLNSVPLGLCRYDLSTEVVAIVLGQRGPLNRAPFEVSTTDGATWLGSDVKLHAKGLSLRDPLLGTRQIAFHQLLELRRRG